MATPPEDAGRRGFPAALGIVAWLAMGLLGGAAVLAMVQAFAGPLGLAAPLQAALDFLIVTVLPEVPEELPAWPVQILFLMIFLVSLTSLGLVERVFASSQAWRIWLAWFLGMMALALGLGAIVGFMILDMIFPVGTVVPGLPGQWLDIYRALPGAEALLAAFTVFLFLLAQQIVNLRLRIGPLILLSATTAMLVLSFEALGIAPVAATFLGLGAMGVGYGVLLVLSGFGADEPTEVRRGAFLLTPVLGAAAIAGLSALLTV